MTDPTNATPDSDLVTALRGTREALSSGANTAAVLARLDSAIALAEAERQVASTPIDIAIHVDGGVVQHVCRVAGDPRPIRVFVHDHDIDDAIVDPDADQSLAHIEFNDTQGQTAPASLATHDGDPVPACSPYWTSLRAEAARLGA